MPNHCWQKRSGGTRPDGHFLAAHARSVASGAARWLCSHSFAQRCGVAEARRIPFPGHSPLCPKCHSISRGTHGKVVWTRESSYANPCTDFVLRSGCNNHPRGRGGPVFLLLGFPSAAAMVFGLDGAPADPIMALARAATRLTQTAREKPRKPPIQRQLFPAI